MKTLVNTKKQAQFKKFMAKDTAFLKKVVGGDDTSKPASNDGEKIKI
jgi:hypothetical protein